MSYGLRKFLVAGHVARDVLIRIDDCDKLPRPFKKLLKVSTPVSKLEETLGPGWNLDRVLEVLEERSIAPICCSYGGRGPNVAYGAALLGARVELVGFVGEDFGRPYPGFYDGSYREHLERAGVVLREIRVEPGDLDKIDCNCGLFVVEGRETPTVYCIEDLAGRDFYLIDDVRGAHVFASTARVPEDLVEESSGVFVTSGEPEFNSRLIESARSRGKDVLFDLGAYRLTPEYLAEVVPKCSIVMGNEYEIEFVERVLGFKDPIEMLEEYDSLELVVEIDKNSCTAVLYGEDGARRLGPVEVRDRVSSVGCCDGFAAGFLAMYSLGYDLEVCALAGLVECSSVWRVKGVQEGMLKKEELFRELKRLCPSLN
ncbi:hypothetical protein DRN94_004375 [archaeon]|nr:hypothetical protein [archaeon]